MREKGVDMCIDVHGDEAIPANFIAFSEGIPGWTDKMNTCKEQFNKFLKMANPDFQTELGYPVTKPGESCLRKATDATAQEFDCFSFTLEMPFKDCAAFPDPEYGWNPKRAKRFGASFVTAIRQIVPLL
jgi:murein tripeptide amidase MpaA